jgi:uncharacterized protein (DUF362 family)
MTSRLALIRGDDRQQNITAALDAIAADVKLGGIEQILVKPNFVALDSPLATTHVDAARAVLAWLRARTDAPILIGEGTASKNTWSAFESYGYMSLPEEYQDVRLMDLNVDEAVDLTAYDWRLRPLPLKASRTVVESRFRVSIGPPKTHDTVLVTLSLKNMIMGSLISWFAPHRQSPNGRGASLSRATAADALRAIYHGMPERVRYNGPLERLKMFALSRGPSSKRAMHQGFPAMNLNLFTLAPYFYPHLAVIDGFTAMEGNGPTDGDRVDWRIALASADWLAADAAALRLMGFELEEIGYLTYCAGAGYGAAGPADVEIVGNVRPMEVARRFRRHASSHLQRCWASPAISRQFLETHRVGG